MGERDESEEAILIPRWGRGIRAKSEETILIPLPRREGEGRVRGPSIRTSGSALERGHREQLEDEVGRQHARDGAGTVVGGRDLHEVGADELQAAQAAHETERLVGGEPAGLWRAGRGRVRGIHRVDVERAIDGPATQPREPIDDPRDSPLLHVLDPDHLEAVGRVEVEILRAVEWAADAYLDRSGPVEEPLF